MLRAPAFRLGSWVLAIAIAATVAGCGDSSKDNAKLSRTVAADLRSDLDQIQQSVGAGDCATAEQGTAELQARIDALPGRVGANLRNALSGSADRLDVLVRDHCSATTDQTTTTPATTPQETTQDQSAGQDKPGKGPKKAKKPKQDQKAPTDTQEVTPNQDGGDQTPPGQQDGQPASGDGSGGSGL